MKYKYWSAISKIYRLVGMRQFRYSEVRDATSPRLLCYLAQEGLIAAVSPVRGKVNTWTVTPRGERVATSEYSIWPEAHIT